MRQSDRTIGKRVALTVLIFVGALTIGLGFYRIQYQVARPFTSEISKPDTSIRDTVAALDTNQPNIHALKKQDTDGDGLSDYDELYVYHTSPYLKDTDSDGYDDKTEIMTGHDPNCPGNNVCFTSSSSSSSRSTAQGAGQQNQAQSPADQAAALQADLQKLQSLTPDQVRQLLKQKGFSDAELSKIDDKTLMDTYKNSLQQALAIQQQKAASQNPATQPSAGASGQNANGLPAQAPQNIQDFSKFSKDQIIKLLSDTGQLSQQQITQLNSLDEATVKQLFMDSLQKAQTQINSQKISGGAQ